MPDAKPIKRDKPITILYISIDDHSRHSVSHCPEAYPWVHTPDLDRLWDCA